MTLEEDIQNYQNTSESSERLGIRATINTFLQKIYDDYYKYTIDKKSQNYWAEHLADTHKQNLKESIRYLGMGFVKFNIPHEPELTISMYFHNPFFQSYSKPFEETEHNTEILQIIQPYLVNYAKDIGAKRLEVNDHFGNCILIEPGSNDSKP